MVLDNVYRIEKPAMLEDMVLFQSVCKFYVLAFITIGRPTSSGLLDYFYLFIYLFIYLFVV